MIIFGRQPAIGTGQNTIAYRAHGTSASLTGGYNAQKYTVSLFQPFIRFGYRPFGSPPTPPTGAAKEWIIRARRRARR